LKINGPISSWGSELDKGSVAPALKGTEHSATATITVVTGPVLSMQILDRKDAAQAEKAAGTGLH
jgi:hypothetical protein